MLKWLKTEFKNQRQYEIALGVFAGLVLGFGGGWLWKEGPTSSEATKLVDVFIAVGTVGAVIAAVSIALWQNKEAKRKEKAKLKTEAARLAPMFKFITGQIDFLLNDFIPNNQNGNEQAITVLTRHSVYLSSYEMISGSLVDIWEIDPEMAKWVSYHGTFLLTQGRAFLQNPYANTGLTYANYFAQYSQGYIRDLQRGAEAAKNNLTRSIGVLEAYIRQP